VVSSPAGDDIEVQTGEQKCKITKSSVYNRIPGQTPPRTRRPERKSYTDMRLDISKKVIYGFLFLILAFSGNAIYSIYTVNRSNAVISESINVVNPTLEAIDEFILLVNRSKMLITNWVYLQSNEVDKQALKQLHSVEYPELKNRLMLLIPNFSNQKLSLGDLDTVFLEFEALLEVERGIMNELTSFEDYEDPIKKFMAEDAIESQVLPQSAALIAALEELDRELSLQRQEADLGMSNTFRKLARMTIILNVALLAVGLFTAFTLSRSITRPINYIREVIEQLGRGENVVVEKNRVADDEIGDMANSVARMASGFGNIARFAENIGKGRYDVAFTPLSEKDVLGNALLEMRDNLKRVAEEDSKRNWATSGMARFGDILRSHSDNFGKLSDHVISNLVKYLGANQGAMFIIDTQHQSGEPHMELAACYAWDKKKFLEKKIYRGEGLAGQAWIEGSTIYLTEVPQDYVAITSGLGEASPRSVVIVPLKVNDEIHGVIELASFREYQPHEIEFIERVSESIAATISSVKVNERTQRLLEESTMMTEQLRAQEEEMRQNMEELQATQEKIQRDQSDRDAREKIVLNDLMVLEFNKTFMIRHAGNNCRAVLGYSASELEGRSLRDVLIHAVDLSQIQEKVASDSHFNGILRMKNRNGAEVQVLASVGLVPDSINNDMMYVMYAQDITHIAQNEQVPT
jgi:PAS domain S-box-containing protein